MAFKIDELYYELDARTAGFEQNISRARTSVANFAEFIRGKPMLAVAAFAAVLIGVASIATKMAADVDQAIRKVQASFPLAVGEVKRLRDEIADLSEITPRSQRELAEGAAAIAASGVDSLSEIITRLRTIVEVADATGAPLEGIADGLDQISDAFRLTSKEAERAVIQIAGMAQGKVPLAEVFATLARGGSVLADLGVKAEDAGAAMIALIDAGVPSRQVGTVLATIIELTNRTEQLRKGTTEQQKAARIIETTLSRGNITTKGFTGALADLAEQLERGGVDTQELGIRTSTLSAITRVAEAATRDHRTEAEKLKESQDRLSQAATTNRESAQALSQILVNQLNRSFIDLGNIILPKVISGLNLVVSALRKLRGEANVGKDIDVLLGKLPTERPQVRFGQTTLIQPTEGKAYARDFLGALDEIAKKVDQQGSAAFVGVASEKLTALSAHLQQLYKAQPDLLAGQFDKIALGAEKTLGFQRASLVGVLSDAIAAAKAAEAPSGTGDGGDKPEDKLRALTQEVKDAIANLKQSIAAAVTSTTVTEIDDARARIAAFRLDVEQLEQKAGRRLPELRAALARLELEPAKIEARERLQAAQQVADEVGKAISVQSKIMAAGLTDWNRMVGERNAEYAKLGKAPLFTPEQVAHVNEVTNALIEATRAAEDTNAELERVRAAQLAAGGTRGRGTVAGDIVTLEAGLGRRRQELRALEGRTDEASTLRRRALMEQIESLHGAINDLLGEEEGIQNRITEAIQGRIAQIEETHSAIVQAIGLAEELAQVFNFGDSLSGVIRGIGQIGRAAAAVGPFLDKLKIFQSGAKDSSGNAIVGIGSLIGAAAPIIGGLVGAVDAIRGLMSDPRAEAARAESIAAMKELRNALVELKDVYLQNVSTEAVNKDIAIIEAVLAKAGVSTSQRPYFVGSQVTRAPAGEPTYGGQVTRGPGISEADRRKVLGMIGRDIGQDFGSGALEAYFAKLDARYGTNLATFVRNNDPYGFLEALRAVPEALRGELTELGRFADTVAGIIERVNYQFDILGKTDAAEKFRAIIDALKAAGIDLGEFAETFATLNAPDTTAEARQAAIDAALKRITEGTDVRYGGLTPEELRDLFKQAAGLARPGGAMGTGGYNTDRTITEVTGARLAAIAYTSQIFLGQIAEYTRAIRDGVGAGGGIPGLVPPPAPPPIRPPLTLRPPTYDPIVGGGMTIGDINVTVQAGELDFATAAAIGERVGGAVVTRLNQLLGKDLLWKTRAAGVPTRTLRD